MGYSKIAPNAGARTAHHTC